MRPLGREKLHRLQQRARIIQAIRAFFIERDFLEVETPQRIPQNAPEPHIHPLTSGDWQLQTSPELAMKRLLAAGSGPIFQISHCWRDEERGRRHLPEFTLLEWYRPQADYLDLMSDCEKLLRRLCPANRLQAAEHQVDLNRPFERLSVVEAFNRHADCSPQQALAEDRFDEVLAFDIEPHLGTTCPTFLYDYPAELAALSRRKPGHPNLAERFELYIAGCELANAFSELADPHEQRRRFEADAETIGSRCGKPPQLPEPFLADLATMPPAAGIALGVDRLVMLLTAADHIDQVVAFPPETL